MIAATAAPAGDPRGSMTVDDVRRLTASPMEHTLAHYIPANFPYLAMMKCLVPCTCSSRGFPGVTETGMAARAVFGMPFADS